MLSPLLYAVNNADSRRSDQAAYDHRFVSSVMSEHTYETVNSFQRESILDVRSVHNPVYRSEHGMAADVVDIDHAEIRQTSRNLVTRQGHVANAGCLGSKSVPYLHPQISESSASVSQSPSPYLIPQPSLGKQSEGIGSCYTNTIIHVVPTNPQTGYSTLYRRDNGQFISPNLNPMNPLYESIKEKGKCVLLGSDDDRVVGVQMSNPSREQPLDAKVQASCHESNNKPIPFESTSVAQVLSSEIVDDSETGYSILRPDRITGPPLGGGSVPHYDTIKLDSLKQQSSDGDMSHSITKRILYTIDSGSGLSSL